MNPERKRLQEQLDQALRDIEEVEDQVAADELDEATARRLVADYEAEAEALRSELETSSAPDEEEPRRSPRRLIGVLILLVGAVVVVVAVVNAVEPEEGGPASGIAAQDPGESSAGVGELGVDPASVTNEQLEAVVAANPEIVPMRLALADRYYAQGVFGKALEHYQIALEYEPDNPHPMAYVGWMSYVVGEFDTGIGLLEAALEVDDQFAPALWFLAQARLDSGDTEGGVELLERLLAVPGLPDEAAAAAGDLLAQVQQS